MQSASDALRRRASELFAAGYRYQISISRAQPGAVPDYRESFRGWKFLGATCAKLHRAPGGEPVIFPESFADRRAIFVVPAPFDVLPADRLRFAAENWIVVEVSDMGDHVAIYAEEV
jgi:hypothetical protein